MEKETPGRVREVTVEKVTSELYGEVKTCQKRQSLPGTGRGKGPDRRRSVLKTVVGRCV